MPAEGRMEPEKLSRPWSVLNMRLSAFPVSADKLEPDLWEQVVGEGQESDLDQPRQVRSGRWSNGVLQLAAGPLVTVFTATPNNAEDGFPNVDIWPVAEVFPKFVELTRRWLVSTDLKIKRIGLGLNALLPAQDRIAAYYLLKELVFGVEIDPEGTSDLIYQINRPVPSADLGTGEKLNRLMKWSAPIFRVARMQATLTQVPQMAQIGGRAATDVKHYAGLETDINTPAEREEPLNPTRLGSILDAMAELTWKNLEYGEKGDKL
jgi:hypothetical protein